MSNSATLVSNAKAEQPKLAFAKSESQLGAFSDVLVHQTKNNANNIVGASNLTADVLWLTGQIAQGVTDPAFLAASAVNASARLPLLLSARTKEKTPRETQLQSTSLSSAKNNHEQTIAEHIKEKTTDALDPKSHPVEASALIAMLAGSIFLALGIDTLMDQQTGADLATGLMQLALGVLTIGGRILEVFSSKESEKSTLGYDASEEKSMLGNLWQMAKDNPEVVSGAIGFASSAMAFGIGIASGSMLMTLAGGVWMASCVLYMAFVRREPETDIAENQQAQDEKPVLGKFTAQLKDELTDRSSALPSLA